MRIDRWRWGIAHFGSKRHNDDVAVEDSTYTTGRRRVAGILIVEKIVGATSLLELYLLYNCACAQLEERDIRIVRSLVGNYVNSLEMAGRSLTVCLVDDELIKWWDAPVHTPALRWNCYTEFPHSLLVKI
jgi:phosphoenolpyruvate---glycerone phosphotransferase subunit DhaK